MTLKLKKSKDLIRFPDVFPIELNQKGILTKEVFDNEETCPNLPPSLLQLHSLIERSYLPLPWPSNLHRITLFTESHGGRGDISAVAKVIQVMQKMCPSLCFDWAILAYNSKEDPTSYLNSSDPTKIITRNIGETGPQETDFLVIGPVSNMWEKDYLEKKLKMTIKGPTFHFSENCSIDHSYLRVQSASQTIREESDKKNLRELYKKVHEKIFSRCSQNGLVMGLQKGSGVFLDEHRLHAPLSREGCCPSYLAKLADPVLKKDIFKALGAHEKDLLPDYDKYSLNFGYAHYTTSWSKFIDFVGIHEQEKNVVITLNQVGAFDKLSTKEFCEEVFTKERLAFLKNRGYGTITVKGQEEKIFLRQIATEDHERDLKIILRPSFLPSDMMQLQLASERLLATGDNTAAEAWASRCKLYLYENYELSPCKEDFLEQQIDLGNTISPSLGRLLSIFGPHKSLSCVEMDDVTKILENPSLSKDTLQFCDLITQNHSFLEVLEGALKRTAWLHLLPDLIEEEADSLDETFTSGIIRFLKGDTQSEVINVKNISYLAERIHLKVQEYLKQQTTNLYVV